MKRNYKVPLIPNWINGRISAAENDTFGYPGYGNINTAGMWKPDVALWVTLNEFLDNDLLLFKDRVDLLKPVRIVQGIPNKNGDFEGRPGHLVDANYYGDSTVYFNESTSTSIKHTVPYVQRAVPLGDEASPSEYPSMGSRMFLVKEGIGGPRNTVTGLGGLDPYYVPSDILDAAAINNLPISPDDGITYRIKFRFGAGTNVVNKSIVCIANPTTAAQSMSIYRKSLTEIAVKWNGTSDADASVSIELGKWYEVSVRFQRIGAHGENVS